jgi:hypothetical protein
LDENSPSQVTLNPVTLLSECTSGNEPLLTDGSLEVTFVKFKEKNNPEKCQLKKTAILNT